MLQRATAMEKEAKELKQQVNKADSSKQNMEPVKLFKKRKNSSDKK